MKTTPKMKTPCIHKSVIQALASVIALTLPPLLPAQVNYQQPLYEWTGATTTGAPASWSDATNWSVKTDATSQPVATDNAPQGNVGVLLGDTTTDREIVIPSDATGDPVSHLWFAQTSAATNRLSVLKNNYEVGNAVTLEASGGGAARLLLGNAGLDGGTVATQTLSFAVGRADAPVQTLTIRQGGALDLGGYVYANTNVAVLLNRGNVMLDGGAINLQQGVRTSTNSSVTYNFNGDLAIASGVMNFGVASSYTAGDGQAYITDVRTTIGGDFTMTGGRLVNVDGGGGKTIWLNGATNTIGAGSSLDAGIQFTLGRAAAQTLASAIALDNILLRKSGDSVTTVTVAATGQNIGRISFTQSVADKTTTLLMGSDLTLKSGSALPFADGAGSASAGTTVHYTIDTAGHTLDLTANTSHWTPNRANANVFAHWHLESGGGSGGTIRAGAFNLGGDGVTVSIGAGATLVATSGNDATSSLGSGGTIDATSAFVYAGGAGATGQIRSDRALGQLVVESGILRAVSGLEAAGGVRVASGATFAANGQQVKAPALTLDVASLASFGAVTGGAALTTGMTFVFNFSQPAGIGDYLFFDTSVSGVPDSISITGLASAKALVRDSAAGTWSGDIGGLAFTFSESTGLLNIAAVAVPESATWTILAGGAALLLALASRKPEGGSEN
jgi:hypothetical protein